MTAKFVPGSDLTRRQKRAAIVLFTQRPIEIFSGTRTADLIAWRDNVTKAAIELRLNPQQVPAFCELAGVKE